MKNFTIICSLVFCTTITSAQVTEDWVKAESTNDFLGAMIARDAENNVFTLGYNFNISTGGTDIFVTKRDASGSLLWTSNFDNTTGQQWDAASWITIDPSGNAIATGTTNQIWTNFIPVQLIVMKFRGTDGMLLWRKTYSTGSAFRASRALTDGDGNIYVGGDTLAQFINFKAYGRLMVKKYSPNGDLIWSVNKDASGNTMNGPMSSMKFAKDGNIVICGVKVAQPYANTTAKITTTDGTVLWSTSNDGYGATDVTTTADGYTYQLWNQAANIRVNKLSPSGALTWSKTYDFGTGDLGRKIEADQNDDLIITGYITQIVGLPYADWMTFKINSDGDQLWSRSYNEHANNDELPNFMALDSDGNIYITGQGGPYPGGSDLSALQTVTVKYQPDGSDEWVALNKPIAPAGIALCLTSDNDVCVLGKPFAVTIHYSQGAQVQCDPPGNLASTEIGPTSAKLKWSPVAGAYKYELHHKKASATNYKVKVLDGTKTSVKFKNLVCNTQYEWRMKTFCDASGTIFSEYTPIQHFTTAPCKLSEEVKLPDILSMTLFPNPASDVVHLELLLPEDFGRGVIELRNIVGQVCWEQAVNGNSLTNLQIDVSNFPVGIYSMSIFSGSSFLSKKMIIE